MIEMGAKLSLKEKLNYILKVFENCPKFIYEYPTEGQEVDLISPRITPRVFNPEQKLNKQW